MSLCIKGEEAKRLLDLLWRMDGGYILTEEEQQHLKDMNCRLTYMRRERSMRHGYGSSLSANSS